jgi:hypothetical protein
MALPPTEAVMRAIEMMRADPKLTRYKAAKTVGVTPGALYNSAACRELMASRGIKKNAVTNQKPRPEPIA